MKKEGGELLIVTLPQLAKSNATARESLIWRMLDKKKLSSHVTSLRVLDDCLKVFFILNIEWLKNSVS